MGILDYLFNSYDRQEMKKLNKLADNILERTEYYEELSDEELRDAADELKESVIEKGVDDCLVDSFAIFSSAVHRETGMVAYKVQLLGAAVMTQGRIAEMKTGEGKSLTILFAAYLRALEGKGCHVVSVNDYLVERDAKFAQPIFERLGLTVGYVINASTRSERREAYNCDVTYVTNSELGFDYLRDNLVTQKEDLVLRDLHYCIIDEIDSILIDEAKTPLIISGKSKEDKSLFYKADEFVKSIEKASGDGIYSKKDYILKRIQTDDGDYIVNRKDKQVYLTEPGVEKAEKFFNISNLADTANLDIYHCIMNALNVNYLMSVDKDYIVSDGQILVVDEYTGRSLPGRRFSHGVHQAIEAKEGLEIKDNSSTLASITFQSFFNKYTTKSGCTGTAKTEEEEFKDIYSLDVVVIPTNKPIARIDHDDRVYGTKEEKYTAIVNDIVESYKKEQPVLVGTTSVDMSEYFSERLKELDIPHTVLNAKRHKYEAGIIAKAGELSAVTIATNMAGRGTDIKVSDEALTVGGLKVIGTERHESRRIDNQLLGRTGRQGNVGESIFYLSLEDDLLKMFCPDKLMDIFKKLGIENGQEIKHKKLSKAIEKAQQRIESDYLQLRKDLLEFDKTNDEQRNVVYDERKAFLLRDDGYSLTKSMFSEVIAKEFENEFCNRELVDISMAEINHVVSKQLHMGFLGVSEDEKDSFETLSAFVEKFTSVMLDMYNSKRDTYKSMGILIDSLEKVIFLKNLDKGWSEHLDDLDFVRQGIYLQSLGNKDPYLEYKFASYELFDSMIYNVKLDTIIALSSMQVDAEEKDRDAGSYKVEQVSIKATDPCICGSGKPFGECCGGK